MGSAGADALLDIEALAAATRRDVDAGRGVFAMRKFYDFWQGPGEWLRLSMDARMKLASRVAKIPLDFEALLGDGMQLRHLRRLNVPTLVLRGEHAPLSSRLVADRVARTIPRGRIMEIAGAGHMGPISHSEAVALLMSTHILAHTVTGAVPALMAA
jgi:pimeloyl-ACP methyl ester carboxylesterase